MATNPAIRLPNKINQGVVQILALAANGDVRAGRVEKARMHLATATNFLQQQLGPQALAQVLYSAALCAHLLGRLDEADRYLRRLVALPTALPPALQANSLRLQVRLGLDQGRMAQAREVLAEIDRDVLLLQTDQIEVLRGDRIALQRIDSAPKIAGDEAKISPSTHLLASEVALASRDIDWAVREASSASSKLAASSDTDDLESLHLITGLIRFIMAEPESRDDLWALDERWQRDDSIPACLKARLRAVLGLWSDGEVTPVGINRTEALRWNSFAELRMGESFTQATASTRFAATPDSRTVLPFPGRPDSPQLGQTAPNAVADDALVPDALEDVLAALVEVSRSPERPGHHRELSIPEIDSLDQSRFAVLDHTELDGLLTSQGFVIAPSQVEDSREYALTVNDLAAFSLDTILDSLERCRLTGRLTVRWTAETISEAVRQQVIETVTETIQSSGIIYFRDGLIIDAVLGEDSCEASPREALSIIVRLALAIASGVAASLERLDTIDRPTTINVLNNAGVILDILRVQDEEAAGLEAEIGEFAPAPSPPVDRQSSQQDPSPPLNLLDPHSVIAICSAKSPAELCASVRDATASERVEISVDGNSVVGSGRSCTEAPFELQSSVFTIRLYRPSTDAGSLLNAIVQVASTRLLSMPPASHDFRSSGDTADFIAESDEMTQVLWRVRRIAAGDGLQKELAHVLITGESGVGKECIAEMIHRCSARKGPWNTRNMSLYSREQAVPEIFGAVKGAYTDLKSDRVGLIEATKGGTILLDEIGEMDPMAQAQLLRVMQTGRYTRLGEQRERAADVRFILATNRDISDSESFRFDLRSRCIEVFVPPLRDRKKDIRPLALHFAHQLQINLTESAILWMENQSWPGNVRQLRNLLLQTSYLLDPSDLVAPDLLLKLLAEQTRSGSASSQRIPEDAISPLLPRESFEEAQNRFVAAIINSALKDARGNKTHAANRLKLSVVGFKKKARRVGLLRQDGSTDESDPDELAPVQ